VTNAKHIRADTYVRYATNCIVRSYQSAVNAKHVKIATDVYVMKNAMESAENATHPVAKDLIAKLFIHGAEHPIAKNNLIVK
jgi:hypothetical protein